MKKRSRKKGPVQSKKITYDGINFASGLERYTYMALKKNKLFEGYENEVFQLIEGFVVIVEGEMDALSFVDAKVDSVVSVPNGATLNRLNLDYLDNCIEYFDDKSKIIIAVDQDEAGQNLQQELIRRFGAEVCYTINFNDCKDANEYMLRYGDTMLKRLVDTASPVPLENVVTLKDVNDELQEFIHEGFKPVLNTMVVTWKVLKSKNKDY